MKTFAAWLVLVLLAFGTYGAGYHFLLASDPRRVLVVLDSSGPMSAVWSQVSSTLADIERRRYSSFALVTEKRRVHGWSDELDIGTLRPFAPRDLSRLADASFPEVEEADEILFLTSAGEAETGPFDHWQVVRLGR